MLVLCAGCEAPILDRFLLTVLDQTWHANCVQCSECSCTLADKCFSRDGRLFCKDDFIRRFGTKCSGCGQGIAPSDLVRRARDRVYHVTCFTCMICRRQLSTGEQLYVLDDSQFICKDDYCRTAGHKLLDEFDSKRLVQKTDENFPDDRGICDASIHDDESRDSAVLTSHTFNNHNNNNNNNNHSTGSTPVSSSVCSGGSVASRCGGLPGADGQHASFWASVKTECDDITEMKSNGPELERSPCLDLKRDTGSNCSVDDSDGESSAPSLNNNNENERDKENSHSKDGVDGASSGGGGAGAKRRGPRTTIKAKQLETLKSAFAATPKPTRHIREQLAQETGLNMRVIQVWFQNRRSKERRMKQLSAMGARRQFFRHPRRLQRGSLRPGDHDLFSDGVDLLGCHHPGLHGYFATADDYYSSSGYPGPEAGGIYSDYYPLLHSSDPSAASQLQGLLASNGVQPPQNSLGSQMMNAEQISAQMQEEMFMSSNGEMVQLPPPVPLSESSSTDPPSASQSSLPPLMHVHEGKHNGLVYSSGHLQQHSGHLLQQSIAAATAGGGMFLHPHNPFDGQQQQQQQQQQMQQLQQHQPSEIQESSW